MDAILKTENLVMTYRVGKVDVNALRGVNLTVGRGEFVSIMGPSGCGKSTMLHILGGLLKPTSGRVMVDGEDMAALSDAGRTDTRRRKIGFVFQQFNLLSRTSALENVELPTVYTGIPEAERERRAREALERVGLSDRAGHHPSQLSGGQQQRVAIARALVNHPQILLADEPTGNLDSRTSVEIMDILQRLNEEEKLTVVIVTHEPDIAQYAQRAMEFRDGRIRRDASIGERVLARDVLPTLPKLDEVEDEEQAAEAGGEPAESPA